MNKIILNTGLWSAIICLSSFIVWIISFVGIAVQSPIFYWTTIEDYIVYVNSNNQLFQYLAKSFMIIFCLAYMVLVIIFSEFVNTDRKILAKIGIVFAIMFALVSSIHYFAQITSVRFALDKNEYAGLAHFLQSNPTSFLSSVNMLGWTLFLALSSLFIYLGLKTTPATKGIRLGLLTATVSCFLGGIGYLSQIDLITFISINLGIGFSFFILTISSIRFINTRKRNLTPIAE